MVLRQARRRVGAGRAPQGGGTLRRGWLAGILSQTFGGRTTDIVLEYSPRPRDLLCGGLVLGAGTALCIYVEVSRRSSSRCVDEQDSRDVSAGLVPEGVLGYYVHSCLLTEGLCLSMCPPFTWHAARPPQPPHARSGLSC